VCCSNYSAAKPEKTYLSGSVGMINSVPQSHATRVPAKHPSEANPSKLLNESSRHKTIYGLDSSSSVEVKPNPKPSLPPKIGPIVRIDDTNRPESAANFGKSAAQFRSGENLSRNRYRFEDLKKFAKDRPKFSDHSSPKPNGYASLSPQCANQPILQTSTSQCGGVSTNSKTHEKFGVNNAFKQVCRNEQNNQMTVVKLDNNTNVGGFDSSKRSKSHNSIDSSFSISDGDELYENNSECKSDESQRPTEGLDVNGQSELCAYEEDIYENISTPRKLPSNSSTSTSGVSCGDTLGGNFVNNIDENDGDRGNNDGDQYMNESIITSENSSPIGWGSDFSSEDSFDESGWLVVCGEDNDSDIYENAEQRAERSPRFCDTDNTWVNISFPQYSYMASK